MGLLPPVGLSQVPGLPPVLHGLRRRTTNAVWTLARSCPRAIWRPALVPLGWAAATRPPAGLRAWQQNITVATGTPPDRAMTRAAARSWARNLLESIQLHTISPEQALAMVAVASDQAERLRAAATGRGAVVALPHQGSWDLSGAWACAYQMPVSTVAEQLGEREFAIFQTARAAVGMRIYSHRDPRAVPKLLADLRASRLVCLVTDRDLAGHGIAVQWPTPQGPRPVRIPGGAALLAQRTGAMLVPAASRYTPTGIELVIGPEIPVPPGADGIASACQGLVDWFAARVQEYPEDWHMMQPFFGRAPINRAASGRGSARR